MRMPYEESFTEDERLLLKFKNQDFGNDEVARILGWDEERIKKVSGAAADKIHLYGALPSLFAEEVLPEVLGYRKLGETRIETEADEDLAYMQFKNPPVPYANAIEFMSGAGSVPMLEFYNDRLFMDMGFRRKRELKDCMDVLVFLEIVDDSCATYALTEFGRAYLSTLLETLLDKANMK